MKYTRTGPRSGRPGAGARAAVSMLVALTMCFGAGAAALPAAAAPAAPEAEAAARWSAQEQHVIDVFNGINKVRTDKGLRPLRIGLNATAVAQEWAENMGRTGRLEHSISFMRDLRVAGYSAAGENVAVCEPWRGAAELIELWKNSPGHYENMTAPNDNVVGIGVFEGASRLWGSTAFYSYRTLPARTYATAEEYLAEMAIPAVPGERPVILGTPAYGQQLRVKPATWPAGTVLSYRWWGGDRILEGETRPEMTVPSMATRRQVVVEVTAKTPGYRETSFYSEPTVTVPEAGWVQYTKPPKITGTPVWGKTLTLDPGSWESGTKLTYQWESGETGLTHVVQSGETRAAVVVTATKQGRYDTTHEATLEIPVPKLTYSVKPSIKGLPAVGQSLTADPGVWNVKPSMIYTWLRNGVVIPGSANYSAYKVTEKDLGAVITFSAEARVNNYESRTVVSAPTAKIGPRLWSKNLTKPTITGTPVVGNSLETNGGTWEKDIAVVDYQWLRDGKPIDGERANFYYLTDADAGRKISVQGIGIHTNSGHGTTVVTSASVTVKPASRPAPEPTPPPRTKFKDVPANMQFAREIQWMADKGISTGWADNTYRPLGLVNRDAMSAFMYRLAGSPPYTAPRSSPFRDIVLDQQFYREMSWLSATGVSTGWPDKTYKPLAPVNRDAMAAFMYRLAGSPKFTPPKTSPFTDVPVSHQFYKEIAWLRQMDISTGWIQSGGTTVFKPNEPVRRDAMAAFMSRFEMIGFKLVQAK